MRLATLLIGSAVLTGSLLSSGCVLLQPVSISSARGPHAACPSGYVLRGGKCKPCPPGHVWSDGRCHDRGKGHDPGHHAGKGKGKGKGKKK